MSKKEYDRPAQKAPRPPHAQLAYNGTFWTIHAWTQEMFGGPSRVFEMAERPDTVVVIPITKENKVVILTENQPGRLNDYTCVPRGLIESGLPAEVAKRELYEETGYVSKAVKQIHSQQFHPKIDWAIFIYVATGCVKTGIQKLDGGEKVQAKEISLDEFIDRAIDEVFDEHMLNHYIMSLVVRHGKDYVKKLLAGK